MKAILAMKYKANARLERMPLHSESSDHTRQKLRSLWATVVRFYLQ